MENDDGSHLRIEPQKAAFELVAIGDHGLVATDRGSVDWLSIQHPPGGVAAGAPHRYRRGSAAMQPGVEPFRVAQRGQITPGPDQCVLDRVLGLFGIPEHEPGGGVQPRDRGACQLGEGVMIASSALAPRGPAASRPSAVGAVDLTALTEYGEAVLRRSFHLRSHTWRRGTIAVPAPRPLRSLPRVKIQEADAKSLLVAQGLPVPALGGRPHRARRPGRPPIDSSSTAPSRSSSRPRSSSAGVARPAASSSRVSREQAELIAGSILGMDIKGITVRKVLVGPAADIVKEFYMSAVLDRAAGRILLMGSAEGGVEIEQVAASNPEAIIRIHADPLLGLLDYQAREFAFAMGLGGHLKAAVAIAKGLVATMRAYDADLVEINPLAIVRELDAAGADGRATGLSRREDHARRLGAPPPSRSSRTCATPTRRTRPTARHARPA